MMGENPPKSLSGSLFHWWSETAEQLPDMFCLVQHALTTKKKKWTKDMNFLQHKTNCENSAGMATISKTITVKKIISTATVMITWL